MTDRPMMACGHVANAEKAGQPCCIICDVTEQVPVPNLEGRMAKCSDCCKLVPSNTNLPFFEFCGEGSDRATNQCKCGYYKKAHGLSHIVCTAGGFTPVGAFATDRYYCGCRGWD